MRRGVMYYLCWVTERTCVCSKVKEVIIMIYEVDATYNDLQEVPVRLDQGNATGKTRQDNRNSS